MTSPQWMSLPLYPCSCHWKLPALKKSVYCVARCSDEEQNKWFNTSMFKLKPSKNCITITFPSYYPPPLTTKKHKLPNSYPRMKFCIFAQEKKNKIDLLTAVNHVKPEVFHEKFSWVKGGGRGLNLFSKTWDFRMTGAQEWSMIPDDRNLATFTWFYWYVNYASLSQQSRNSSSWATHPLVWHVHLNLPSEITVSFRIIMPVNYYGLR